MIKITKAKYIKDYSIELIFSTNELGVVDFTYLLAKDTVLTNPLKDINFFTNFFLELGAICWSNGLELSSGSIYQRLKETNNLTALEKIA